MQNWKNTLYYGDNLRILRERIASASVDLVYLDPPFNSNRNYNVLFKDESGEEAEAQITAFEDTWHWNEKAEATYQALVTESSERVSSMIGALHDFIGTNQMMAYLVMMAARLVELHRVLKPTGSLYQHCDPTASHYLKIVTDTIFSPENFLNEIVWRRTGSHNKTQRYAPIHDVILFYAKTKEYVWKQQKRPYMQGHVDDNFAKDGAAYKTKYSFSLIVALSKNMVAFTTHLVLRSANPAGAVFRQNLPNTRQRVHLHLLQHFKMLSCVRIVTGKQIGRAHV